MKKTGYFLLLIAALCFAVSAVFLFTGLFQKVAVTIKQQRMILAGITCAGGVAAILLYLAVLGLRKLYTAHKGNSRRSASNSGSVLLMVLVLLGVAAGLLMHIQSGSRARLRRADSEFRMQRLRFAAADTARHMLQTLADDEDLLADHSGEAWAEPVEIDYPDGTVAKGRIMDEQRFFDINNLAASRPVHVADTAEMLLNNVMRQCGMPHAGFQVAALKDWVDADQEGQYESSRYMDRETPYRCPDAFMEGLHELKWIEGWSRELFTQPQADAAPPLEKCLSVAPVERREPVAVNVNTASGELLEAMLGNGREQLVHLLVSMRSQTPLTSLALLENAVGSDAMERLRPFLDVKSRFFRLVVEAAQEGRTSRLTALARRGSEGDVQVLRWTY